MLISQASIAIPSVFFSFTSPMWSHVGTRGGRCLASDRQIPFTVLRLEGGAVSPILSLNVQITGRVGELLSLLRNEFHGFKPWISLPLNGYGSLFRSLESEFQLPPRSVFADDMGFSRLGKTQSYQRRPSVAYPSSSGDHDRQFC